MNVEHAQHKLYDLQGALDRAYRIAEGQNDMIVSPSSAVLKLEMALHHTEQIRRILNGLQE